MVQRYYKKLLIIILLIAFGIWLKTSDVLDVQNMLSVARVYADHWWLILVLILLPAVMFTFALAGSLFLWVVAPLYPPVTATFILVAGSTLGGISAYFFSQRLADDWVEKIEKSRTYKLLQQQDNFFTLFALRVFPGFPHALVNYSAGILNVKLSHFIAAAILGIAIKSYVYSNVIYNATTAASFEDLLDISTFGPLILLSAFTLIGVAIRFKLSKKQTNEAEKKTD